MNTAASMMLTYVSIILITPKSPDVVRAQDADEVDDLSM